MTSDGTREPINNPPVRNAGVDRRRVACLALFSLLGAVAHLVPVPLMFGVHVLPGTVLPYLVLLNVGLISALLVALPGLLVIALVSLSPATAFILLSDLLVVGLLTRRFPRLEFPLLVAMVWLPVGALFSYLLLRLGVAVPAPEARLQSLALAFNAIAAAALAVGLKHMLASRVFGLRSPISISDVMFFVPTLMVISVSALLLHAVSLSQLNMMERQFSERLSAAQRSIIVETEELLNSLDNELGQISEQCFAENRAAASSWLCVSRLLPLSEWSAVYFRSDDSESWRLFGRSEWLRTRPGVSADRPGFREPPTEAWQYRASGNGSLYFIRPSSHWPGAMIGGVADLSSGADSQWPGAAGRSERFSWVLNGETLATSAPSVTDKRMVARDYGNLERFTDDLSASATQTDGEQVGTWRDGVYALNTSFAALGLPMPGSLRLEVSPQSELALMNRVFTVALMAVVGFLLLTLLLSRSLARWLVVPMNSLVRSAQSIPGAVRTRESPEALGTQLPVVEMQALQSSLADMHVLLRQQYELERDHRNRLSQAVAERTHELEAAYRHITNILDSMDGVLWSARRGEKGPVLELVTRGVEAMTGYRAERWQSETRRLLVRVPRSERATLSDSIRAMSEDGFGEFELGFYHARGDLRRFRIRHWLVLDSRGKPASIAGLVLDHTAWVEAQEKIRAQEELLVHQSRRAAMGEIVSNVAHQWRQPLNSIRLQLANIADALDHDELTPDDLRRSLRRGDDLIQQMNQTVRNFMTFFRPGGDPVVFELSELLKQACDIAAGSLGDVPIQFDMNARDSVRVSGFPNEMLQALLIVLQNAREAIEREAPDQGRIAASLRVNGDWAIVTIEDNGEGVSESGIDHVFDPYFTIKSESAGMGLYMAKGLVEGQMHGAITIDNSEQGAVVTLRIPVAGT